MKNMKLYLVVAAILVAALSSAQTAPTPVTPDFASNITAFSNSFYTLLTTDAPYLLGALLIASGFGMVWRLLKSIPKMIGK